ncbi:MAG: hypothetical protein ABIG90_03075 [bacterium]
MSIFKQYDIRGRYPEEINKNIALKIVKALKAKNLVLGHDGQRDSRVLSKAIIQKFKNIIDLGHVPISLLCFAIYKIKPDVGIMITASHLPKNYAGFKIFNKNGLPIRLKSFV